MSMIIRGLFGRVDSNILKQELDQLVPEKVAAATKFETTMSSKNRLYLESLCPGKTFTEVYHISELHKPTITGEKPQKKDSDVQCHRCQRWGHIARNCNSAYNCVKCSQVHQPGECQRISSDTSEPYCINCTTTGHSANCKGCPVYKIRCR